MPLYLFENVDTGEHREVFFGMNDNKVYNGEGGLEAGKWERRYYVPQAAIDTKINPESSSDFREKTGRKHGTVGNILDAAKEASDRRAEIMGGVDPIKDKYVKDWKTKRKGNRKHPSEINRNIEITF